MPVIQHFLQRLGFVKLTRYGLVMTPEGRIATTRTKVLDDGVGGAIVGWEEADPVAALLPPLDAPRRARTAPPVQGLVSRPAPAATPAPQRSAAWPASPVVSASSREAQAPAAPSAGVMPPAVTPEPVVDEDEWEWVIALARARAAAGTDAGVVATEPVARAPIAARPPTPSPVPLRMRTRPMATVVADAATSAEWPMTLPIGAIDYEDYSVAPTSTALRTPAAPPAPVAVMPTPAAPAVAAPRTVTPSTVIPVPALPTMHGSAMTGRFEPVVRTATARLPSLLATQPPAAPARFSKGTVSDPPAMSDDTQPSLPLDDRTKPGIGLVGMIDDRTKPGITLPPAARAVQLPSIKRRASLAR